MDPSRLAPFLVAMKRKMWVNRDWWDGELDRKIYFLDRLEGKALDFFEGYLVDALPERIEHVQAMEAILLVSFDEIDVKETNRNAWMHGVQTI